MKIRSSAVLPAHAPVCCGRSIFSVSLKYPYRALCLSLFYLYEWFCSRNKCLSANFFFFPLEEKMNCMSVCTDNGWKTNRICFAGVFIYVFSELDGKVPFKTPQTHQLLCFKWRLKLSAFQERHSKGWNLTIVIALSAGGGFIRIPWSPSQRWRNGERQAEIFAGEHTRGQIQEHKPGLLSHKWDVVKVCTQQSLGSNARIYAGAAGCTLQYDNR